ncbi:MAG TPA: pentapeptide repeat-containing protein, partial [Solirubrobacteraceae bacterium]
MLDRQLLRSKPGADVRAVARTATLTAVRRLNGERRGLVVRFLAEARLLGPAEAKVELLDADLRASDASFARLGGAHLDGANLDGANLDTVQSSRAHLSRAR